MWVCQQCVLSAGTKLCDGSVICKVASLRSWTVNKFYCGFSIWSGQLIEFFLFWLKSLNPLLWNVFSLFSRWLLEQFVWVVLFTHLLWPYQTYSGFCCLSSENSCFLLRDYLFSSINGLRIVCLSYTSFWLSVFWVQVIQEPKTIDVTKYA